MRPTKQPMRVVNISTGRAEATSNYWPVIRAVKIAMRNHNVLYRVDRREPDGKYYPIPEKPPLMRLMRLMMYVACLSQGEADACIRGYRSGNNYVCEAVMHFGGAGEVIRQAMTLRRNYRLLSELFPLMTPADVESWRPTEEDYKKWGTR